MEYFYIYVKFILRSRKIWEGKSHLVIQMLAKQGTNKGANKVDTLQINTKVKWTVYALVATKKSKPSLLE